MSPGITAFIFSHKASPVLFIHFLKIIHARFTAYFLALFTPESEDDAKKNQPGRLKHLSCKPDHSGSNTTAVSTQ